MQADFITSASREDLLADKQWNRALLLGVIKAFLLGLECFADHPTLRNVWFRHLFKSISDTFFAYAEHNLMSDLQGRPILRSSSGTLVRAAQLIILLHHTSLVPPSYRKHTSPAWPLLSFDGLRRF